jgi:hypothetical protein
MKKSEVTDNPRACNLSSIRTRNIIKREAKEAKLPTQMPRKLRIRSLKVKVAQVMLKSLTTWLE